MKQYAALVDGKLEFVPLSSYAPKILKAIDDSQVKEMEQARVEQAQKREEYEATHPGAAHKVRVLVRPAVSPIVDEGAIGYYFSEARQQLLDLDSPDTQEHIANIDDIEKEVLGWEREENPIRRLEQDMRARGCTPLSVQGFVGAARRYMRFVGWEPSFSKAEVTKFLASLDPYKGKTRHFYRAMLQTWFRAMELPWVFEKAKFHYDEDETETACYTTSEMKEQIRKFRDRGSEECQFYMAIATYVGFRGVEMGRISNLSFLRQNGDLYIKVRTAKRRDGHHRLHRIPTELLPYVEPYVGRARVHQAWEMRTLYKLWCKEVNFDSVDGFNFHAIRHAVLTSLIERGIDSVMADSWMGWKSGRKGSPVMAMYYYKPQELEEKVLAKHPYIREWAR